MREADFKFSLAKAVFIAVLPMVVLVSLLSAMQARPENTKRLENSMSDSLKNANVTDLSTAGARLAQLTGRIAALKAARHDLLPYLLAQTEIIERLIRGIEDDRKQAEQGFLQQVQIQAIELEKLLESLDTELNLIDRNRQLAEPAKDRIVNVRDFGAVGDGLCDDGPAIRDAIAKAAALAGGAKVIIPTGRYAIESIQPDGIRANLLLSNLHDLTIEAEPETILVMKNVAPGIVVDDCRNILLRNIGIDYDPLPFTQGKIVAVNPEDSTFDMTIDDGFPSPIEQRFVQSTYLRGTVNHPQSGEIDHWTGDPRISSVKQIGHGLYRLTVVLNDGAAAANLTSNFRPGCIFVLHARGAPGGGAAVSFHNSKYVTLEAVRVYASYSLAFYSVGCEGIKLRRCTAEPLPGSNRLTCSNADGFLSSSARKGPWVQDCHFYRTNDDDINILSRMCSVASVEKGNCCVLDRYVSCKPGEPFSTPLFKPSDAVAFLNPNTGRIDALAKVESVTSSLWHDKTNLTLCFDRDVEGILTRRSLDKDPIRDREYVWHGGGGKKIEHFLFNLHTKGDGFVIRNNRFGHHRARGIKIQSSNGIIEGNHIESVQGVAIFLCSMINWLEAYPPRNVVVRNNTSVNNGRGLLSIFLIPERLPPEGPPPIRRVLIEGNKFLGAIYGGIILNHARDVRITDNWIQSPKPIVTNNCSQIEQADNTFGAADYDQDRALTIPVKQQTFWIESQ